MNRCRECGVLLIDLEQEENDGLCHICYAEKIADREETLKHPDRT